MTRYKRLSGFILLAVVLMLAITFKVLAQIPPQPSSLSFTSELENAFRSPKVELDRDNRQAQKSRCPCSMDQNPLSALAPPLTGQTTAERPTVFWYMPKIMDTQEHFVPAPEIEFTLRDANDLKIYSAIYPLTKSADGSVGTPGIMSLSLAKPYHLKVGQEYKWQLRVTCDATSSDRSQDELIEAGINRIALDPTLARRLQQAAPEERIILYARAQLWYEMLAELVKLRRDRPDDPNLADAWEKLFIAVGLDSVSQVPRTTNNP